MDYSLIIDNMMWSFSRLNLYYACPYSWFLQYIEEEDKEDNFYAQYGSYMHSVLEKFYSGELQIFELSQYFDEYYDDFVTLDDVYSKGGDLHSKYREIGIDYLDNIEPLSDKYKIVGVEEEIKFKIGEYNFVGYIDLLLEDENGDLICLDHKSYSMKFKKNGEMSESKVNIEQFEEFKIQQYLYSIGIYKKYGKYPKYLEWNFFKVGEKVRIEFDLGGLEKAEQWAIDTIEKIKQEALWLPNGNWYRCSTLCSFRNKACEFSQFR